MTLLRMTAVFTLAILATANLAPAAWSAVISSGVDVLAVLASPVVRGGGRWSSEGNAPDDSRRWHLDVQRAGDGALSGRVDLSGSPLAAAGNVVGKVDGRRVYGTILDDTGQEIATFHGVANPSGMHGTYRDRTGETGRWHWDEAS